MTRKEFVKFAETRKHVKNKKSVVIDKSVTDPTFAQSGRQMITNPLPIEYRMKYPAGVPLNPDNPMHFNEFDKLYPDTFKAIREANAASVSATKNLGKLQDQTKKKPTPTPNPNNN